MLNLAMALDDPARRHPGREAVVAGRERLTYGELSAAADRVAGHLAGMGVRPGDAVALSAPNGPDFVAAYFGVLRVGAVVVPLNPRLPGAELAWCLRDAGARVLLRRGAGEGSGTGADGRGGRGEPGGALGSTPVVDLPLSGAGFAPPETGLFPTVYRSAEDTAAILYTSGTSGRPKGVELTHASLVLNAFVSRQTAAMVAGAGSPHTRLVALPLFHAYGQSSQMNAGLLNGDRLVLLSRFEPGATLDGMARERVGLFAGVPTMYVRLLAEARRAGGDLVRRVAEHLVLCTSGGASLSPSLLTEVEETFGVVVLEGYGLTETSPTATINPPDLRRKPGSVGLPVFGSEVRIADAAGGELPRGETGEVLIRGHHVMKGYRNQPEATERALRGGWLHTGDLGRLDADGYLYLEGRQDDMILRGGYKVHPEEVEHVIEAYPGVLRSAVIGEPHVELGEEIRAAVLRDPGAGVEEAALLAWCRDRLAPHKVPRVIEFVDDLPVTETGKLLRRVVRERLGVNVG